MMNTEKTRKSLLLYGQLSSRGRGSQEIVRVPTKFIHQWIHKIISSLSKLWITWHFPLKDEASVEHICT